MLNINSVCVFCGSKNGKHPIYEESARRLGEIMAERSVSLVYGGGRIGLMGVVSDTILERGGKVVGVLPKFLKDLEVANDKVTELIITNTMHERKNLMFKISDGFVVLPGGLGTLDEILEILTWKQLRLHSKPVVILNVDGYWSPLSDLVNSTIDGDFAHPGVKELFTMVDSVEDVFPFLVNQPNPKDDVLTSHL
ncbi:MAG: TIGR00730 family Rossman fold protein [Pseudomonadota bacterium]|nr:TIGR00730 family Rossman fold protein [Pseudomonadota bacterium]